MIKQKTARRWLSRNRWKIAEFLTGVGASVGSNWHKQLMLCKRVSGDVRFRRFKGDDQYNKFIGAFENAIVKADEFSRR